MTQILYKYRFYCVTEGAYKEVWAETPPVLCPSDGTHTINTDSITIIDTISDTNVVATNVPKTTFDEVRVAERTTMMELKSMYGMSPLRDIVVSQGTGTVVNQVGDTEYTLTVAGSNDIAWLQSAERGRYVAGLQGDVGVACRLSSLVTGNRALKIGLFDENDGFYFKYTSSNVFACVLRAGEEYAVPREAWAFDRLDGTGPSKFTLNPLNGNIYSIRFSWYGYGAVEFSVNGINSEHRQNTWLAHVYHPTVQTSVKNPNLPLSVKYESNGTIGTAVAKVAGRQYSLLGKYTPITRTTSVYRTGFTITSSTTFVPVISLRRKTGYLGTAIKAIAADMIATADMLIQIRTGTTLTGGNFTTPNDTLPANTALEYDISATSVVNGTPIWTGIISGETKSSVNSQLAVDYNLTGYNILTICAKLVSPTVTSGTLSIAYRVNEEW